jgi:hypothetical protein
MQSDFVLTHGWKGVDLFFLWQLSRLMEGKFRRRDDWVLMAGVCLTAGAPGWMSPGLVWWGVSQQLRATVCTRPRRTDQGVGWGWPSRDGEVFRQRGRSWWTQRYSAVREPKSRQLARVSKADKQGERVSDGGPAGGTRMGCEVSLWGRLAEEAWRPRMTPRD